MAKKKETKDAEGFIEIPFGAFDSETISWTYTIPEGFTAKIEDGKIIVEKVESDDEKIRKELIEELKSKLPFCSEEFTKHRIIRQIAYLEKQKKQKPTVNIDNFKSFMMQYLQDAANRKIDSEIEADTDKWAKKLLNLIEVKEQKSTEWSEEDEKIMESLLRHFRKKYKTKPYWNGIAVKDIIVYLEKQKAKDSYDRMTPIYGNRESFESALDKAWKFYNESGSSTVDGCEDNAFELAFAKGFREGFLYREQKEQRPVQDKEEREYVRTLKSIISDFLRGKDEIDRSYYQKIYDWLDERHIEQKPTEITPNQFDGITYGMKGYVSEKPAEWSEGKDFRKKFVDAVYDCAWGKVTCKVEGETREEYAERWAERLISMLRYDKGKTGGDKIEWSEEDKKDIQEASDYSSRQ